MTASAHVPGHTTETSRREPQDFTEPVHHVDLEREALRLLDEASANPSQHAARTISKDGSLSVSLIAMLAGSKLQGHSAHGSALLQALRGHAIVSLADNDVDLGAGQVIALASHVPHGLRAEEDSVLLLAVAGDK